MYILAALVASCSFPAVTPTVIPTEEIIPSATAVAVEVSSPTAPPLQTDIPATVLPVVTPPIAQVNNQPFSAILVRIYPGPFLLLGGTENGEWLTPEAVAPHLLDGEMYPTFYSFGPGGLAKGKAPNYNQICREYQVETDSYPLGGRAVAVTGDWNVMPRVAQELPTEHATYVEEVKNWLIEQNFSEPIVKIDQILRVDMEGDGTEEVLISASHFVEPTGHSVGPGDYSLVLMRKVVGNSVVTIPIVGDYYYDEVENQFPLTYNALFVVDLNNDGILEILVGMERWEGNGVVVYEVDGVDIKMATKLFCGL